MSIWKTQGGRYWQGNLTIRLGSLPLGYWELEAASVCFLDSAWHKAGGTIMLNLPQWQRLVGTFSLSDTIPAGGI